MGLKKITEPLGTTKKSRNLSAQQKITKPLGTKKATNIWGQKNHATSQEKNHATFQNKNIMQNHPTSWDKNHATSWDNKKNTQPLGTKKITQPIGTKKNDTISQYKKVTLSIGPISSKLVH